MDQTRITAPLHPAAASAVPSAVFGRIPGGCDLRYVEWADILRRSYCQLPTCGLPMFPAPNLTLSYAELHECAQYARVRMARDGLEWLFMMPLYVLGHFFGDQWVRQHLFEKHRFLKPPPADVDWGRHQQAGLHGYQLAEALFNLQDVEGFPGIHYRLLKGEIEPCIGELEAARFLKIRGEQFRFVVPQGRRGEDYDIEILRDTGIICCETKVKLETEELTAQGVYRSLEDARKRNLPKSRPGVIFLRIVGNTTNGELQAKARIVDRAVRRLFRQTKRIVGVVLLTRMYRFSDDDEIMWSLWRTMPNASSDHSASLLDNFPNEHIEPATENWTYLMKCRPRFIFRLGVGRASQGASSMLRRILGSVCEFLRTGSGLFCLPGGTLPPGRGDVHRVRRSPGR